MLCKTSTSFSTLFLIFFLLSLFSNTLTVTWYDLIFIHINAHTSVSLMEATQKNIIICGVKRKTFGNISGTIICMTLIGFCLVEMTCM